MKRKRRGAGLVGDEKIGHVGARTRGSETDLSTGTSREELIHCTAPSNGKFASAYATESIRKTARVISSLICGAIAEFDTGHRGRDHVFAAGLIESDCIRLRLGDNCIICRSAVATHSSGGRPPRPCAILLCQSLASPRCLLLHGDWYLGLGCLTSHCWHRSRHRCSSGSISRDDISDRCGRYLARHLGRTTKITAHILRRSKRQASQSQVQRKPDPKRVFENDNHGNGEQA
jgi:hypothetical protein